MAPKPLDADPLSAALLAFQASIEAYILPILPPPVATIVKTGLTTTTTIQPYLTSIYTSFASMMARTLQSSPSSSSSSDSPEAASIVTTLIMLGSIYLTFRMLNYVRRTMMSWIMFSIKLGLILILAQIAWYIQVYGMNKFMKDAAWVGELLWRVAEEAFEGPQAWKDASRNQRPLRSRSEAKRAGQKMPFGGGVGAGGRTRW